MICFFFTGEQLISILSAVCLFVDVGTRRRRSVRRRPPMAAALPTAVGLAAVLTKTYDMDVVTSAAEQADVLKAEGNARFNGEFDARTARARGPVGQRPRGPWGAVHDCKLCIDLALVDLRLRRRCAFW